MCVCVLRVFFVFMCDCVCVCVRARVTNVRQTTISERVRKINQILQYSFFLGG
jgi:hypothetical protein